MFAPREYSSPLGKAGFEDGLRPASVFDCLPELVPRCSFLNFDKPNCLPSMYEKDADVEAEVETLLLPPQEVFPSTKVSNSADAIQTDAVLFQDGFALLKVRLSSPDLIGLTKKDRVPGKYEGGLKIWDGTVDLVNTMRREIKDGQLSFRGKRVLELGCGNGFPGIVAILKGASAVHFQDLNEEVLRHVTIPNVAVNREQAHVLRRADSGILSSTSEKVDPDVRYYAGDWGNVSELLSVVGSEEQSDSSSEEEQLSTSYPLRRKRSNTSRAFERALLDVPNGGYDIILMSETVYALPTLPKLYNLVKKCLRSPYGVLYLSSKKHYIGVGGGSRQFKSLVDQEGILGGRLVTDFSDGPSSVREVWKFFLK